MYYPLKKGLYPKSSSKASFNASMAATGCTIIFAVLICCVGGMGHLIASFKGSKSVEMTEDLAVTVGGSAFFFCAIFFKLHFRKWVEFFHSISDFKAYGKPEDFNNVTDRCNFLSMIYSIYISGGMCVYAVISIFETKCVRNEQNNFCGTLTQIRLPIEGEISPLVVKIIFLCQLLVCIWACLQAGNIFFLSHESSEFIICHINALKKHIIGIFNYEDELSRREHILFCIGYHNQIIKWGFNLNRLTKNTLGHMSLVAAIALGMIGNQILHKYKMFGAAIYLGGYVMAIFLVSHAGQRLSDESISIAKAIFDSDWTTASTGMRKDLTFMLARSQIPLYISCLPFGNFNYALFVTMLKASYSYLTLLQQSTSNKDD